MKTMYTWKNKKADNWVKRYWKSKDTRLSDVYKTWSCAKTIAYEECYKKMYDEGGEDFRIISHNRMFFTVGWRTRSLGDYRIETPSGSYLIIDMPF